MTLMSTDPQTHVTLVERDTLPLKLAAYAAIHDAILRDLARLEAVARHAADVGDERGWDRAGLQRWWARFEGNIEHHHEREDDLLFPLLLEKGVELDLAGLTADHEVLDVLMAEVRTGLAVAPPAEVAVSAGALRAHMDLHLAREEYEVFPAADRLFTEEEYADLEAQMREGMAFRELGFTLPWLADDLHPRLLAHLLAGLPAPLRMLHRLFWQRSYATVAAPLRGVAR